MFDDVRKSARTTCADVPKRALAAGACLFALLLAGPSLGQTESALDDEARELAQPPSPLLEIAPADAPAGDLTAASPIPQPTLIREGAVMSQRAGVMRRLRGGGWAFLSTRADDMGRVAVIMLPCTRLTEMARLVDASPDAIGFEVSGQVFSYHGRNYLLPTRFRTASVDPPEAEATPDPSKASQTDVTFSPDFMSASQEEKSEPTIDDLLAAIEDRSAAPSPDREPESLPEDTATSGRGLPILREGMVLHGRTGRLRPAATSSGSGWMLVGEADADTDDDLLASVPLILMPCQNLSGMERLVQEHGDTLRFSVSGVVHVYDGQNHLLPTMYLVELDRSGNLTSAQ